MAQKGLRGGVSCGKMTDGKTLGDNHQGDMKRVAFEVWVLVLIRD